MLNHIVLLKCRADVSESQRQLVFSALQNLVDLIPGLLSCSSGANNSPEQINRGFTHAFHMQFIDSQARDNYIPHPEHELVKTMIGDILAHDEAPVLVIDYQT